MYTTCDFVLCSQSDLDYELHVLNMHLSLPKTLLICREGYPPERGYGGAGYGEPAYSERGAYGSGYGGAAYDRGYDERGYGGRDAYSSRAAAPAREPYSRPGPEREYARPAARAPGPYERPASSLPPR